MDKPRLLFLAHRVPYPPDKGERLRAFHEIRLLRESFQVTVATLAHHAADRVSAQELADRLGIEVWCESADRWAARSRAALRALLRGRSVTECYFTSSALRRRVIASGQVQPWDIVVGYCSSMLPYVQAVSTRRRVMDLVDVDSAKWVRYAETARWPARWLYRREGRLVGDLEQQAIRTCDAVLLVSQAEADVLTTEAENVWAVGNGVDTDYFHPAAVSPLDLGPQAVVFTGTMDYLPNIEGVTWFVREVWPAVHRKAPAATFTIVGRDPTPAVRKLADVAGVHVTGSVPDVRPYLAGAALSVCPLLTARGIQNKILEALAMGVPVLATPPAAEGLDVEESAALGCCPIDPSAWSAAVCERISSEVVHTSMRIASLDTFSWEHRLSPLMDIVVLPDFERAGSMKP